MQAMYEYRGQLSAVFDDGIVALRIDLGFRLSGEFRVRIYGVKLPSPSSLDVEERKRAKVATDAIYASCYSMNLRVRTHRASSRDGLFSAELFFHDTDGHEQSLTEMLVKKGHAERAL